MVIICKSISPTGDKELDVNDDVDAVEGDYHCAEDLCGKYDVEWTGVV